MCVCCVYVSGEAASGLEPRRIEQLCRKNIISFAYGSGPHLLAVTASMYDSQYVISLSLSKMLCLAMHIDL